LPGIGDTAIVAADAATHPNRPALVGGCDVNEGGIG